MTQKLFLFDIDGTLLSPGLLPRQILNRAFIELAGASPDLQFSDVAGQTDYLIINNALRRLGIHDGEITDMAEQVLSFYLREMAARFPVSDLPVLHQDAVDFLAAVQAAGQHTALLTGNVEAGARIKLERFNLYERFAFGAFGDDSVERSGLPVVAQRRAREILGIDFTMEDLIIVGDTPNDAYVAKSAGARAVIVCRRPEWEDEIRSAGADIIVDLFSDSQVLLNQVLGL